MADEPLRARCICTMRETEPGRWEKPESGYLSPRSDCPGCGGTGFISKEIKLGGPGARWFFGVCPVCGFENGGYIQYPGQPAPPEYASDAANGVLAHCLNNDCPNEYCAWIEDVEEEGEDES